MVKLTKKMIYASIIIVLLIIVLFSLMSMSRPISVRASLSTISPSEMVNSLTVRGTVESTDKYNVFTSLSFLTKEIMVEVGDKVDEGEVLCQLDTEDLRMNIEQLKADLDVTQLNNLRQYEDSKDVYEEAKALLAKNKNGSVLTAQTNMESAKATLDDAKRQYDDLKEDYAKDNNYDVETTRIKLDQAQKDYDDAVADLNFNRDPDVMAAENTLARAAVDLEKKESTYNSNKILYHNGVISRDEFERSEADYLDALINYEDAAEKLETARKEQMQDLYQLENDLEKARTDYENALKEQDRALEEAKLTLDSAQTAYDTAVASYDSAVETANQELNRHKTGLDEAEIALNNDSVLINIARLEKQLEDSTITSPAPGTVTEVYAEEGSVATGMLFIVEDTESLKVVSTVKEYDYSKLKVGMEVIIRLDSTDDYEYEGILSKIDPAAVKDDAGESTGADVEFGITIDIKSTDTQLRIGMSTRLEIVLEKKSDVYYVPYDAVRENENGDSSIFVAYSVEQGVYGIRQIFVNVGMSNDFHTEISSNELSSGMTIINDPSVIMNELEKLNINPGSIGGLRFRFI